MTQAQAKPPSAAWKKGLLRLLSVFLVATLFTAVLHFSSRWSARRGEPAGFALGVLHGALMPGALPHLLIGNDVTIYATPNTGRTYKLGYTTGVNACGALFFGLLYFRFNRWRRERTAARAQ